MATHLHKQANTRDTAASKPAKADQRKTNDTETVDLSQQEAIAFDFMRFPIHPPAIQPKLTINEPGDAFEQEADAVAEKVMRMDAAEIPGKQAEIVQRKCAACEEEENIQRKTSKPPFNRSTGPVEHYLNNPGVGQSMAASDLDFFTSRMGYDFSSVKIYNDASASQSARSINALAYTYGSKVVFGAGQYQPGTESGKRLLAHELTHVAQQGAVKAAVDTGTAAGQSKSLSIRNNLRSVQAKQGLIQRATFPTFYGDFKDKTYKAISKNGVNIELEFHPGPNVNATKIGLTQMLKSELGGASAPIGPTQAERMVTSGYAEGTYVDRIKERNNPVYGGQQLAAADSLSVTNNAGGNFHLGWNYKDAAGLHTKEAYLSDTPTRPGRGKNSGQIFETTALAIDGAQKGTYYGSVSWGWTTDAAGKFSVVPIAVVSKAAPSDRFFKAAEKWNAASSLGTIKTTADPTNVYNKSFKKSFTVPKDETVTLGDSSVNKNIIYQDVTIVATGKTGKIRTGDLKDQGDGTATVDLPIVTEIYAGPYDDILDVAPIAQVPRDAKVKVVNDTDPITVYVEVMEGSFAGTRGYVNKIGGIPFKNIVH